jgi:serine/threonine protein kinase
MNFFTKVAVKILEKSKIIENSDKVRVEREIKILKKLIHKNIIQLYQVFLHKHRLFKQEPICILLWNMLVEENYSTI